MAHALRLGARASGRVRPRPAVGCVLVADGRVVGRGSTDPETGDHAEVVALRQAGDAARGSTAYVTLEPCSHHGRTPPCADALIAAGVARVVAALEDPNPQVAGQGLSRLREAGLDVQVGCRADAARRGPAGPRPGGEPQGLRRATRLPAERPRRALRRAVRRGLRRGIRLRSEPAYPGLSRSAPCKRSRRGRGRRYARWP